VPWEIIRFPVRNKFRGIWFLYFRNVPAECESYQRKLLRLIARFNCLISLRIRQHHPQRLTGRFLAGFRTGCNLIASLEGGVYRNLTSKKSKVKCTLLQALRLCTGRTAQRVSRGIAIPFLDHGTWRGLRGQLHAPAALYPWERPGTHCTGDWVDPRASLDRCGKSRLHRDSIPGPSSP